MQQQLPESVVQTALLSRIGVLCLQFVANNVLGDHDAGVFLTPTNGKHPPHSADALIESLFGGLRRWDAHYYMHIAEHGYSYENTTAFYPLLPIIVHCFTRVLCAACAFLGIGISFGSAALLIAVLVNLVAFMAAARTLQTLTDRIFKCPRKARSAAVLFAFNPASVFFSAPYSESMFAWSTFSVMDACHRRRYTKAIIPLALSIACRSNGLINCGFIGCYLLYDALRAPSVWILFRHALKCVALLAFPIGVFVAIQWYQYRQFCIDTPVTMAAHVRAYGERQAFVLAGQFARSNSSWCWNRVPLPYSYVQQHYWNVGLFAYYQPKQIPNFLLAAPILWLFAGNAVTYFSAISRKLGDVLPTRNTLAQRLFVFQVHAAFLALVCVCYVHIQVSTRLLASASPCLYWIGAAEHWPKSLFAGGQANLMRWWFVGYFVLGTILFSNFYPWT